MSCTDTDKAAVSLGTAAAVQVTSRKYMEPFPFISAYPAVVPGCCSPEVQLYSGFWLVSWFRDNLAHYEKEAAGREGGSPEQYLDRMLPQIPAGSEGLVFSPYFIAGVEMPKARGAYIGFTDRHTRAHMYRALIEGIALALRTGLEHLEKKGRFSVRDIYICGGGAVSDEVCRIVASVFGLPVHRTEAPEASGVGCAVSVFTAMGVYSSHEHAMVKENAQLLNMPVVKGDFDRQIAKQDYYTERQELVLNQLIKQKASFELLHLSYEIELRKHWDIYRQLENLVHLLNQSNLMFHQRLEMLTDPSVSQQINPRNTIDTKDYSTHR